MPYTRQKSSYTTHSYVQNSTLFEQSLDIYHPSAPSKSLPTVILVVGSGWMGHRSIIYAGCSWWNAKGPRTIASTGATCVCVRHKGAFPVVDSRVVVALAGFAGLYTKSLVHAVAMAAGIYMGWTLMRRGSATLENMMEDVATAIEYIKDREDINTDNVVLGGYSSGGHVLTSLLNRPDILKKKNLPAKVSDLCNGVLLLSGVLGTEPSPTSKKPRWFTDIVVKSVWGSEADKVPSPVHKMLSYKPKSKTKDLPPHLLVGCGSETFGIPLLDTFFCRDDYAAAVKRAGGVVETILVSANHWTVLDCDELFVKLFDKFVVEGWPKVK
ncbi:hypothetical protein TrVE_jg9378 [Triparma verrucosa]|uniref:Alpha/beta hydrolase fold-3 domain-containing protein n=1 Tax=Triparma verrucosa TaxID=1606542 RepID=A0A9W6Z9W0_9STRA|nr:hypothetical protein TrVE_jg9378 [Triparma verrucosa]